MKKEAQVFVGILLLLTGIGLGRWFSAPRKEALPTEGTPPTTTPLAARALPTLKPDLVDVPISLSYEKGKCRPKFTDAAQKAAQIVLVDEDQSGVRWIVTNPSDGGCSSGSWEFQLLPVKPPKKDCLAAFGNKMRKKDRLPKHCKRLLDVPEHLGPGESQDFDCKLPKKLAHDGCYAYEVQVCAALLPCEPADPELDFRRK